MSVVKISPLFLKSFRSTKFKSPASITSGHLKLVNLLVKLDGQARKFFSKFNAAVYWFEALNIRVSWGKQR